MDDKVNWYNSDQTKMLDLNSITYYSYGEDKKLDIVYDPSIDDYVTKWHILGKKLVVHSGGGEVVFYDGEAKQIFSLIKGAL